MKNENLIRLSILVVASMLMVASVQAATPPLTAPQGGTGLNGVGQGLVPFGQGASNVRIGTSNSLFWDNANSRLGIGTSSPSFSLSVAGATGVLANYYTATSTTPSHFGTSCITGAGGGGNNGIQGIEICGNDNTTNGVQAGLTNVNAGTSAYSFLYFNNDKADLTFTHYAGFQYNSSTYSDTTFGTAFAVPHAFLRQATDGPILDVVSTTTAAKNYWAVYTGGSATANEHMRITSAGNVGIGTTTPGSLLSIGGTATGWNFYDNASTTKSGIGGINILQGCYAVNGTCVGGGSGTNYFTNSGANTYLSTGTNLGIGTSTPYGQVGIGGLAVGTTLFEIDALSGQTASILDVRLASSTKLTVSSAGNVGIGTSTPQRKLDVAGTGNTTSQVLIEDTSAGANMHYQALQSVNGKFNVNSANDALATTTVATFATSSTPFLGVGTTTQMTSNSIATLTTGASATTTINVGNIGDTSSKTCFNLNASDGTAGSFYMNAAHALVAEANACR